MQQQPSIVDKAKMGAIMGASVGATMGLLFGSYTVLRFGPGPKGYLGTVGQYMAGSGVSFAFFLSIGSCLRNEPQLEFNNRMNQRRRNLLDRQQGN